MKTFKLTDETITIYRNGKEVKLHRIEAICALPDRGVKIGDIGGYIEKEENLSDDAWVSGDARVYGNARVSGNAEVSGNARVYGKARVSGNACVYGNAWVYGKACVSGNACVSDSRHIVWLSIFGSRNGTTTAYMTQANRVEVMCGCFRGSIDEFAAKIEVTHKDTKYLAEYRAMVELLRVRFAEFINEKIMTSRL